MAAKRRTTPPATEAQPANASAPTPTSIQDVLKAIGEVRGQRDELKGRKAAVDALKAKYTEAKDEYEALVAKQAFSEAALLTAYPEARAILGDAELPKRRGRVPKAAGAKAGKLAGKALSQEQAEKVLGALGSTFIMGEFRRKVTEMFPEHTMKGSLDLITDKIKATGGKAMGTKYKKV